MRLVRELLVADADAGLATADARARAARYVDVVTGGLGVRAAALVAREPSGDRLACLASTLPAPATSLLAGPDGPASPLVRRACDERRAFLARRATDDPLVRAVRDADPAVETIAVLPLADRVPSGVLVIAGDETSLAADVVRTLNPALRLLALLVAPQRDGVAADPAAFAEAQALRMEIEAQQRTVQALEAHVRDLEASLAAARAAAAPQPAPDPAAHGGSPPVAVAPDEHDAAATPTIVVVDAERAWGQCSVDGHDVVVVAPSPDAASAVAAAHPTRVVVNLAAAGGLAQAIALRAHGVRAPIFGVVAAPGHDRVVGVGMIEAVGRPTSPEALVAAVERAAPRGARVFAAGRDAEALMKMRQHLAKQGLSVSMARDTKQIDDLLAMVRPQVVVIDLALPMRQGYELIVRMASTAPAPALVLIAPDADPSPILQATLRERLADGAGVGAKQWLVAMAREKIPARPVRASAPVAAH